MLLVIYFKFSNKLIIIFLPEFIMPGYFIQIFNALLTYLTNAQCSCVILIEYSVFIILSLTPDLWSSSNISPYLCISAFSNKGGKCANCSQHATCKDCLADIRCGWCGNDYDPRIGRYDFYDRVSFLYVLFRPHCRLINKQSI